MIYLDNSATTPLSPSAIEGMRSAIGRFGNPSSTHFMGREAARIEEETKIAVLRSLDARIEDYEVIFTSGGTEANNLAVFGTAYAKKRRPPDLVTTDSEHPCILEPCRRLEGEGFSVVRLKTAGGRIDEEELKEALNKTPFLLSVMAVNNETGAVYGVERIFSEAKALCPGVICHSDAVQAYGKIPLSLRRLKADLLTLSAHKIHGPKGCGALVVRRELLKRKDLTARLVGGGQEGGLRSGTQNTVGIAGFGGAVRDTFADPARDRARLSALRAALISSLPDEITVNEAPESAPHIVSITLPHIKSETALNFLSGKGICVSNGSACASNGRHKSYVLSAFGLCDKDVDSTLRVSFSPENTAEEVSALVSALEEALKTLVRFK